MRPLTVPRLRPSSLVPRPTTNANTSPTDNASAMAAMHLMNSRVVALVRGVPKSFAKVRRTACCLQMSTCVAKESFVTNALSVLLLSAVQHQLLLPVAFKQPGSAA